MWVTLRAADPSHCSTHRILRPPLAAAAFITSRFAKPTSYTSRQAAFKFDLSHREMGKQKKRNRKKKSYSDEEIRQAQAAVGSFQEQGGWGRLLKLDHQDKLIIALIFFVGVGKLVSQYFYPEEN